MVGSRTRLINQMRAFCLEYGVALRQGAGLFKLDLPQALNDPENDLSPAMRRLLGDLHADLLRLEERIRQVTKELEAIADREDVTRRLMTIPGSARWALPHCWPPSAMGCSSAKPEI